MFIVICGSLLLYPPYFRYKIEVLRFLTGSISATDYQLARRITFSDDATITGLVGRLRYSLLPIFFLAAVLLIQRSSGVFTSIICALILFAFGPASMSKAPIVIYSAYFILATCLVQGKRWIFKSGSVILLLFITVPTLLFVLTGIYFLQYRDYFTDLSSLPDALRLAYFRVFDATYQGFLMLFTVYPETGGFVGLASIGTFASLAGIPVRNVDVEVAVFFLGPDGLLTSLPTIFIGGAYASFGYIGVAIYSLVVCTCLSFTDYLAMRVENRCLRAIYLGTLMINVLYLAVLAAPAAMITYGCAVIPLVVYLADRFISHLGSLPRSNRVRRVSIG